MKHELVFIGKTKEDFIAAGIAEYASRLQHYTRLSLQILKERKHSGITGAAAIEAEGELFLAAIPAGAVVIALDVGGDQLSSEKFATLIDGWEQQGIKKACFLIGGFAGLAPKVLARADLRLSLSRMTFTHDMARLLLVEQLYRAYTIKAGENYHK